MGDPFWLRVLPIVTRWIPRLLTLWAVLTIAQIVMAMSAGR